MQLTDYFNHDDSHIPDFIFIKWNFSNELQTLKVYLVDKFHHEVLDCQTYSSMDMGEFVGAIDNFVSSLKKEGVF